MNNNGLVFGLILVALCVFAYFKSGDFGWLVLIAVYIVGIIVAEDLDKLRKRVKKLEGKRK